MASMKFDVPQLDRSIRFSLWQVKIRAVLAHMDLDDALLGIEKMPESLKEEEKKRKDKKALALIQLHLSNSILQEVLKEDSAAGLWVKLEQLCSSRTLTSKLHLKQRLYSHRLAEGGSLESHLVVFKEIVSDLEAMEQKYLDEDLALILLSSLPASYGNFRDTILYSRETLASQDVLDALFSKQNMEKITAENKASGESMGLVARDHGENQYGNKNREKTCFYCKKKGHIKAACYSLKNKLKEKKEEEKSGEAGFAKGSVDCGSEVETEVYFAAMDTTGSVDDWICDTGSPYHICPLISCFSTYVAVATGAVYMGNGTSCHIAGTGTVRFITGDGVIKTLEGVKHVPNFRKSVMSLSSLALEGYGYSCAGGVLSITMQSVEYLRAEISGSGHYVLQADVVRDGVSSEVPVEVDVSGEGPSDSGPEDVQY